MFCTVIDDYMLLFWLLKKYIEILNMRYVFILIVFGSRKTKEELTQIG